jgi:hypothetical protein
MEIRVFDLGWTFGRSLCGVYARVLFLLVVVEGKSNVLHMCERHIAFSSLTQTTCLDF